MDDKEFRRAILADPYAENDDIKDAIKKDPSKKEYLEEIRSFDAAMEDAMDIDVPEGLESKLMRIPMEDNVEQLHQPATPTKTKAANDSSYWQIAAAACFAFVIGLSINLNVLHTGGMGAGDYALKYSYQDIQNVSETNQQIPLDQVNAKLASYGVQMEQEIGNIQYANSFFCSINEANVLHLVVAGEAGNINLLVLPKDNNLKGWDEFSDSRFNGTALRYSKADMVIVGEKEESLGAFQSKVENSMKWKI